MCIYIYIYVYIYPFICLSCFQILALVNSAAMNIGGMYFFKLEFSPDIFTEMGLLGHRITLFLVL